MARQSFSFGRLMVWTLLAAVVAVAASLAYLASEPGRMHLSEILVAVFGVGLTVIVAGGLAGLMFLSAHSGHDDKAGRGMPPS